MGIVKQAGELDSYACHLSTKHAIASNQVQSNTVKRHACLKKLEMITLPK